MLDSDLFSSKALSFSEVILFTHLFLVKHRCYSSHKHEDSLIPTLLPERLCVLTVNANLVVCLLIGKDMSEGQSTGLRVSPREDVQSL